MKWYLRVLKQYAVFEGRARRREYWWFALVNFLVILVLSAPVEFAEGTPLESVGVILTMLYLFGVFVPGFAVSVRRLHDIGRSGWWLLVSLIPLLGSLVLLVFFLLDSEPGENKYGPNPKEMATGVG